MLYVTHETIASTSGIATRLLAEKLMPGTTSNMFPIRMKKKNAARSGMNLGASGPSIGSAMFSRTNWTPSSISSWNLPGMTFGLRNAKKNSARTITVVKTSRNVMKLKQSVNPKILNGRTPAPVDEVLGARRFERRGEHGTRHGRPAPSNVQRSACIRPESALASKMSSPTIAGTSVERERHGENHDSWFKSTSATV